MVNEKLAYIMSLSEVEYKVWVEDELKKMYKRAHAEFAHTYGCAELDIRQSSEERSRTLSRRKWLQDREHTRVVYFEKSFAAELLSVVGDIYSDRVDYESFSKFKGAVSEYEGGLVEKICLLLISKEAEVAALRSTLELLQVCEMQGVYKKDYFSDATDMQPIVAE